MKESVQSSESCSSSLAQKRTHFISSLAVLDSSLWASGISTYKETNDFIKKKRVAAVFQWMRKKKSRFPKVIQRKEFLQAIRSPDQTGCNRIRDVPERHRAEMEMKLKAVGQRCE